MAVAVEDGVEARIARVESDVGHVRSDIAEIKIDLRELRGDVGLLRVEVGELRGELNSKFQQLQKEIRVGDLHTRIWMLVMYGTLLAVMARGFKWI